MNGGCGGVELDDVSEPPEVLGPTTLTSGIRSKLTSGGVVCPSAVAMMPLRGRLLFGDFDTAIVTLSSMQKGS